VESILTGQTVVQTGTLIDGSAPIVGFAFKNQEAGTGSISDAYFNNIAIVDAPEPSVIGIAALGVATVLFRRFRRR
jgi:hypothetical protein